MKLSFYRLKHFHIILGLILLLGVGMLLAGCGLTQNTSEMTATASDPVTETEETQQPTPTTVMTPTPSTPGSTPG